MAGTRRSRRSRRSKIRSHGRRRTSRRVSRKRGRRRKSYKKRRQRGGNLDSIVSNMLTETGLPDKTSAQDLSHNQMERLRGQLLPLVQEPAVAFFLLKLSEEREAARTATREGKSPKWTPLRDLLAVAKALFAE